MEKADRTRLVLAFTIVAWAGAAEVSYLAFEDAQESVNRDLVIQIKKQNLETFSTQPGRLYESVGKTSSACTITYHGNGVATSAAHCFEDLAAGMEFDRYVRFHCDEKINGGWDCSATAALARPTAMITEVAIPEHYRSAEGDRLRREAEGYDIAFIRMIPVKGAALPAANFPLSSKIETLNVSKAGYNAGSPGLTGDLSCKVTDPNLLPSNDPSYVIQTDCYSMPGSSGGPLIDENHRVIGINSTSLFPEGGSTSFSTPITPGLKAAFEKFRVGALEGDSTTHEHWRGPYKITRFSYERVPVEVHLKPCC